MDDLFPGPTTMVQINGARVRQLRERKGLTQLYLATAVGVTTETISRWENRRYPSIKFDNAGKLAQALEVDLAAILQGPEDPPPDQAENRGAGEPATAPPAGPLPKKRHIPLSRVLLPAAALALGLLLFWWWPGRPVAPRITAVRTMPAHSPAGRTFPLIIQVTSDRPIPYSVLLKESLPLGCTLVKSAPPATVHSRTTATAKWISRSQGQGLTYVLLVRIAPEVTAARLEFSGTITLKKSGNPTAITGATTLVIADFHWADTDRDGIISDAEILEAYDRYDALDKIGYDWDLIDEIWSGSGYRWDSKGKRFVVIP
ncbi:MAG: helix-turn-helix domain-containing protein [Desulfobacterales bacterium]|nr:helix-turn-helix domain-containing protein [Desulfobacterales bacterium]